MYIYIYIYTHNVKAAAVLHQPVQALHDEVDPLLVAEPAKTGIKVIKQHYTITHYTILY